MATSASRWSGRNNPVESARAAVEHAIRLVRLELELRLVDWRRRATAAGIGAGLGVAALLLVPLLVGFLLAAAAAALATTMSVWLAILIVALALGAIVAGLAGSAVVLIRRGLRDGGRGDG